MRRASGAGSRKAGQRPREPDDRDAKRGNAAAVHAERDRARLEIGELRQRCRDAPLQRMLRSEIRRRVPLLLHTHRQHAAVLSRAVVVDRRPALAGARHGAARLVVRGSVRAATQRVFAETRLRENLPRELHMHRLAVVRRADKSKVARPEAERIGRAGLHHGNRLDHLERAAQKRRPLGLAQGREDFSLVVGDDEETLVQRFRMSAALDAHPRTKRPGGVQKAPRESGEGSIAQSAHKL